MFVVREEVLREQIRSVFLAWGMMPEHADIAAEVMVETDLAGIDSHGIGMLPAYQRGKDMGRINVRPEIEVVRDAPSLALIDADHSLGHIPGHMAMELAMEKAGVTGLGAVVVRNSNHYGAAGYYSQMAAKRGLIGLSMTGSPPLMVPTFGKEPMLGTNPIAFAAPAEKNPHVSLDMATTTVAMGKVTIARRLKKPIPEGWAVGFDGEPITDYAVAAETRRLTPLGGNRELGSHKGYGLAMMVDVLSGILGGPHASSINVHKGGMDGHLHTGHFLLALDPGVTRDDGEFGRDMDGFINRLHKTAPADPAQPVRVAGDPEREAREERLKNGIPISETLYEEVREVASAAGVPFLFGN